MRQIKGTVWKVKWKRSLFSDDVIAIEKSLMKSAKTLLELISEFSMVEGYIINMQKIITFCILSEHDETKIISTVFSTIRNKNNT